MGFNIDKCHVLTISKKKLPLTHHYSLHHRPLERVQSAKYLGVELSSKLQWNQHIEAITNKANRVSAFLTRNLRGCSQEVQAHCLKGLARPLLEYASPVWDPHQQTLSNLIEKTQRRAARRIAQDFSPDTNTSDILEKLKLPPLRARRQVDKATVLYKLAHGLVDWEPLHGTLTPAPRSSRGRNDKYLQPYSRTDAHRHSLFPSAIRLWNSLPAESTVSGSIPTFKSSVGGWLGMN